MIKQEKGGKIVGACSTAGFRPVGPFLVAILVSFLFTDHHRVVWKHCGIFNL